MHPTAKLMSQAYTSSQRIMDIAQTGPEETLAEMSKLSDILVKTRKIGFDELLNHVSHETIHGSSEGIEANGILEKMTDARILGLDLIDKMKGELNDPSKKDSLAQSVESMKVISDKLLTIARSTHELTKGIELSNESELSR